MTAVAAALAGAMFYLSIGTGTWWPLAWLAPVPLLVRALNVESGRARAIAGAGAAAAMAIGTTNLLVAYRGVLPVMALAPVVALTGASYGALVWWFAVIARRSRVAAIVGFAAGWTSWEWIGSLVSPHGTAGSIAYSQASVPAVAHVAALVGQYGITLLLGLVPATIAVGIAERRPRPALLTLAAVAAVLGLVALLDPPTATPTRRVAAITSDVFAAPLADTRDLALAPVTGFEPAIARAAADGAKLIVLPERVTTARPAWRNELDARWQALADRHQVELVVGVGDFSTTPPGNRAVLYRPGSEAARYTKHHLIPGIEPFAPGTEWLQVDDTGVVICKDLDFQDTAHGNADARVVAAPAWDFGRDGELHRRMAILRAIEGGFALVRSARDGRASLYDAWGRQVGEARSDAQAVVTVIGDLPLGTRRPPALGLALGLVCVLLTLGVAAAPWLVRRRGPDRPGENRSTVLRG